MSHLHRVQITVHLQEGGPLTSTEMTINHTLNECFTFETTRYLFSCTEARLEQLIVERELIVHESDGIRWLDAWEVIKILKLTTGL